MTYTKKYPSGLRLVANQIDYMYTVSFGVYVDVGSVREDKNTNGFSHFIEHMLFKGTSNRTALEISSELEDVGAVFNAGTSKDCTSYYTKSAYTDLEKCVDVLADMYFNSQFPEEELDKERGVVLEEIKMCLDTPDDLVQDLVGEGVYSGQPMGQTILGSADNIRYCDRHSILNFMKKHYIPQNTVISVAGRFDFEQLDALVQKYFESNFSQRYEDTHAEPISNYTSEFRYAFKDIEQSHVQLAWGGCTLTDEDRPAIAILNSILGGGMTSRLFQVIREQHGLAYSVYSMASFHVNCGLLEIYVGTSPENYSKVCQLLEEVITNLVANGITQKELDRAIVNSTNAIYSTVESNNVLMRLQGRKLLKTNVVYQPDEEVACYKVLTVEKVNVVLRKIFSQKHASAYVGKEIENFDAVSKILRNK